MKQYEWLDEASDKLQKEKKRLEARLRKQYQSGKRYVRRNPAQSAGFLLGLGLAVGLVVGALLSEDECES